MMPRSTSTSSNLTLADKRKSILSIDGALDAMKAKDMWKGLKGVANPPDQVEAARKRGMSMFSDVRDKLIIAAEQAIVKWEDDSEVRKCRICLYVPLPRVKPSILIPVRHSHSQTENTTVEYVGV
jgi:rabenosyn-5